MGKGAANTKASQASRQQDEADARLAAIADLQDGALLPKESLLLHGDEAELLRAELRDESLLLSRQIASEPAEKKDRSDKKPMRQESHDLR